MSLPILDECWVGVSSIWANGHTSASTVGLMIAQPVSTIFISILLIFHQRCLVGGRIRLLSTVHLFGVMFALMGLSVCFVNVQAVEIPEVIGVLIERFPLAGGRFFFSA